MLTSWQRHYQDAGFTNMRTKNTVVSMSDVATGQPRKLLSPENRLVIKVVAAIAIIVGLGLVIAAGTGAVLYTVHEDLRYASGTFSQAAGMHPASIIRAETEPPASRCCFQAAYSKPTRLFL
jgi:hypothetical protein